MWNRMRHLGDECGRFRTSLEDSAVAPHASESVDELLAAMPSMARNHFAECLGCQEVAQDLLTARRALKEAVPEAFEPGPWFAGRVIAAIAVRERAIGEAARTWLVVPRFASRLAVASGALLLVASTWLYERPLPAPSQQASSLAAQESLFESPPPMNQDDVLINLQESNP
jgi:hypothetical protein